MPKYRTVITNVGLNALSAAIANGETITLSHIAVGDGNGQAVEPNAAQLSLVNETARVEILKKEASTINPGLTDVLAIFPTSVGGFTVREVGVLMQGGALFAVANMPDYYKPTAADGIVREMSVRIPLEIDAGNVEISITPETELITRAEFDALAARVAALEKSN